MTVAERPDLPDLDGRDAARQVGPRVATSTRGREGVGADDEPAVLRLVGTPHHLEGDGQVRRGVRGGGLHVVQEADAVGPTADAVLPAQACRMVARGCRWMLAASPGTVHQAVLVRVESDGPDVMSGAPDQDFGGEASLVDPGGTGTRRRSRPTPPQPLAGSGGRTRGRHGQRWRRRSECRRSRVWRVRCSSRSRTRAGRSTVVRPAAAIAARVSASSYDRTPGGRPVPVRRSTW